LLGFFGVKGESLFAIFKQRSGRKIEKPEDLPTAMKRNISAENLTRIYNDAEVQAQLRRTIHPLHQEGIDEFQTRRNGLVIESVFKSDLQAADEAELQDTIRDEEITLDIEKTAWRRNLAWHFRGGGISFDAKIEDDKFWKDVEGGEAFAVGDRLKVHLRTTAHRTEDGRLKVQRTIPQVLEVEHARLRQRKLFADE
jgi:hypothetical protein